MQKMKTLELTVEAAEKLKYVRLTNPYVPGERWMMDRVCDDMRAGGIDHAIVPMEGGLTVWRKSKRATAGLV